MFRSLMALCIAMLLGSCSRPEFLVIYNNSGAAIEVVSVPSYSNPDGNPEGSKTWSFPWTWRFLIPQGAAREVASNNGESWFVELSARGCSLQYVAPNARQNFGAYEPTGPLASPHVRVQLEPDLQLYLVPYNARDVMPVAPLIVFQPNGYPAVPAMTCGSA